MYKFVKNGDPMQIIGDTLENNFMELLKLRWDELHNQSDVFRYKIDNLQERLVNGYLLQLNPDRGSNRRQPEIIDNVCQPFDKDKFNFTKVSVKEILFNLFLEENASDMHSLIVNVSPISRYHTLLCPLRSKCLPQVVTQDGLEVALDIMFFAKDRDLRIGFNSLCALASVNHLHYHLFLVPNILLIETAKCKHIQGPLFCFKDYPTPGFCFQITSQESVKNMSEEIYKLLRYLLENSIAHNLFITRGDSLVPGDDRNESLVEENDKNESIVTGDDRNDSLVPKDDKNESLVQEDDKNESLLPGGDKNEVVRVIVWPRISSSGAKQLDAFNVAVCELSGWFPVFDKTAYKNLKPEDLEHELRKWQLDNFDDLCVKVKTMF